MVLPLIGAGLSLIGQARNAFGPRDSGGGGNLGAAGAQASAAQQEFTDATNAANDFSTAMAEARDRNQQENALRRGASTISTNLVTSFVRDTVEQVRRSA